MSTIDADRSAAGTFAGPPAPESPADDVLDLQGLLDRCMGNLPFAQRIAGKFQQRFELDLAELKQCLRAEDSGGVASLAHRIKGASANASAGRLQQAAGLIEELGRAGRLDGVAACLERLDGEWTRYLARAASLLAPAAAPRTGT